MGLIQMFKNLSHFFYYAQKIGVLFLISVCVAMSIPLSTGKASDAFVFTAIPDEDESRLRERFNKVASYLESKLGVAVTYIPVSLMPLPLLHLGMIKFN